MAHIVDGTLGATQAPNRIIERSAQQCAIPAIVELAQLDQWVISKYVRRRGKLDKPPFSPILDADHKAPWMCSHSDPSHWASYDVARAALGDFLWLGFVFHESDPYSGIDLDGCCKPDRERIRTRDDIEPWALHIIDLVNSYTEISPSGKGVKIFVRGTLAETLLHSLGEHKGLEVYSKQRYFTVTGQHLAGTPSEIRNAQAQLDQLDREYRPAQPTPRQAAQQARTIISLAPRQQRNERASLDDVKAAFNTKNPLSNLLASYGAKQNSGKDYTCPFCEHSHNNTLFLFNNRVYSRSPGCKIPQQRGLDSFGLYVLIEHNDNVIAALKALNPIVPRRARQEAPPPAPEPARQRTAEHIADAARKRAQRTQEAAEVRASVEQRAAADDRLTDSDRATLHAMLAWAAEKNSACCWLGRAAIAERAGYSLGSVKRSVMRLEELGYFESSGEGGRPIDTAKRTFTRGSCLQPETIFVANDDPRILIANDLPTQESVAREGRAAPPAAPEPAEWEYWQPADTECSPYDLALEAAPATEETPAPVEPEAKPPVLPDGWHFIRPSGPYTWATDGTQMTATHLKSAGDAAVISAAWAMVDPQHRAVAPQQAEPKHAQSAPSESECPYLASYSPPAVEPRGAYTGRMKALLDFAEQWREATSAIKVRADVADEADRAIEQHQIAAPPVRKASKRRQVSGLDRYRANLALMSETQLAGELTKHQRTIDKYPRAVWLKDVRAKLDLVQAEIDQLDQRDGERPQARPGVRVRASAGAAPPLTSSPARRPAPNPFAIEQASHQARLL